MIFSFNIRFLIFIWASGRAIRSNKFASRILAPIPDALHSVTQCIPAPSKMAERCSRSRAHGIINFSLSLKMCKDKVGLKYPFINLYQKLLNIRARKRTRTFNNFYYRTPNVYFFPALLFCTSRKKRKKIYFRVLESGLPHT